jgi:hypothetical protein
VAGLLYAVHSETEESLMLTVINVVLLVMALVVVFYGVKLLLNRGA